MPATATARTPPDALRMTLAPATTTAPSNAAGAPATRVAAIDAYRGFVMFLMMAEVLRLQALSEALPGSRLWELLAWHQTHVDWAGCTLHDMIQPSFSFLVGVSLPFSIASRRSKGQGFFRMAFHAAWRAVLLTLLGVFLRSVDKPQTYWTFEDTLSQIGLGYLPLFLLGLLKPRWQIAALVIVLAGMFAAFAFYPLPGADFKYASVGVGPDWPNHYQGFAAHFNKNSNVSWAFDTWFLNLFPREGNQPFTHNGGGYSTLSFIPTLGTMILGLLAGGLLIAPRASWKKWLALVGLAALCLAIGGPLDYFEICPAIKRIWTPSWVLTSGGFCFLYLAGFYLVMDMMGLAVLGLPLRVIGANAITAYVAAHLWDSFIRDSLKTHFGQNVFADLTARMRLDPAYTTLVEGALVLLVFWLILLWMYRQKFFVRI